MTLYKQGRAYFQIAGAGHEALLTGARPLASPRLRLVLPLLPRPRPRARLGVTADEVLLQAVGSAEDPSSGGRQMPAHWGARTSTSSASRARPAASASPRSAAPRRRATSPPRASPASPRTHDEVTYVSLGDGATSEGEFWESLNTACRLRSRSSTSSPTTATRSRCRPGPGAGPISELVSGFPGLVVARFDGCDYFESRARRRRGDRPSARGRRPGAAPRRRHPARTRTPRRTTRRSTGRPTSSPTSSQRDPLVRFERELLAAGVLDADDVDAIRAEAHDARRSRRAQPRSTAPRPDPATVDRPPLRAARTSPMPPAWPRARRRARPLRRGDPPDARTR